ncbi:MAG: hypothetical protein AB1813_27865 [Verrucomicrobiota bacterium]
MEILSYSQHPELFELSSQLVDLPYPRRAIKTWQPHYTVDLVKNFESDWIIHLDEDAFLLNSTAILRLMEAMVQGGFVCCGMPDGGVIDLRFHNPVACNPFFLILHRAALLQQLAVDPDIESQRWQEQYRVHTPDFVRSRGKRFEYNEAEPYYCLFFWLCRHGFKTLYLDAEPWPDEAEGITTLLKDHEGNPFLLHTWYSREFRVRQPIWKAGCQLPLARFWMPHRLIRGPHFERITRAAAYVQARAKLDRHAS